MAWKICPSKAWKGIRFCLCGTKFLARLGCIVHPHNQLYLFLIYKICYGLIYFSFVSYLQLAVTYVNKIYKKKLAFTYEKWDRLNLRFCIKGYGAPHYMLDSSDFREEGFILHPLNPRFILQYNFAKMPLDYILLYMYHHLNTIHET